MPDITEREFYATFKPITNPRSGCDHWDDVSAYVPTKVWTQFEDETDDGDTQFWFYPGVKRGGTGFKVCEVHWTDPELVVVCDVWRNA